MREREREREGALSQGNEKRQGTRSYINFSHSILVLLPGRKDKWARAKKERERECVCVNGLLVWSEKERSMHIHLNSW